VDARDGRLGLPPRAARIAPAHSVVVLSALDLSNERLQELRANALIGKPFDLDVLYGAVHDVLPKRS